MSQGDEMTCSRPHSSLMIYGSQSLSFNTKSFPITSLQINNFSKNQTLHICSITIIAIRSDIYQNVTVVNTYTNDLTCIIYFFLLITIL